MSRRGGLDSDVQRDSPIAVKCRAHGIGEVVPSCVSLSTNDPIDQSSNPAWQQ
jgi:hypothetical protein